MTATSTRTPAQLRAAIEDEGGAFVVLHGVLRIFAKPSTLARFRDEIKEHRHALLTHVRQYPCRTCGRSPGCTPLRCSTCAALNANARIAR